MRFVCKVGEDEHIVEADTPREAAQASARKYVAAHSGPVGTYVVNVAEANDADFPLIAGEDYTVTIPAR